MYGDGGYTAVLQGFGQVYDDAAVVVPSGARLYGHRQVYGINNGTGDFEHFLWLAQHSRSGAFAGNFFDRASEIDVQNIRAGGFGDASGFDHRIHIAAVNLYGCGALGIVDVQFACRGCNIAYQRVRGHKFGIGHISSHFLAYQAEGRIGHVLHRS